jgi:hypothetical protein
LRAFVGRIHQVRKTLAFSLNVVKAPVQVTSIWTVWVVSFLQ